MRFAFAALLAVALGLLPAGTARAQLVFPAPASMPCHGTGGTPPAHTNHDAPDDVAKCADHCLSQVNGQAQFARLSGPALQNGLTSEPAKAGETGKPRLKDPPDPPPPRG